MESLEDKLRKIDGFEFRNKFIARLNKQLLDEAANKDKYLKEISSMYDNRNLLGSDTGDKINHLNLEVIKSETKIQLLYGLIYLGGLCIDDFLN
jgi:hypothetical protein